MWKVLTRVVNSSILGSSFFPDLGFGLLFSFLNCKARTSIDTNTATRDAAREAADRIMANLDSLTTGITSFSSVTVFLVVV